MSVETTHPELDLHQRRRGGRARLIGASTVLSLALVSATAMADTNQAAAEAAFSEGVARLEAGEVSAACRKFESAVELTSRGALGGLLLLGDCYVKEQRIASAWAVYKEVVPKARRAGQAEREAEASRKASALEPRLARIRLVLSHGKSAAQLSVTQNGSPVPRGLLGTPLPVDAGRVVVELSAPGYQTTQVEVEAKEGEVAEVQLPPLVATDKPNETQPPSGQPLGPREHSEQAEVGTRSPVGLIVGGVGLLGMATAGVLGLVAKSNYDSAIDDGGCNSAGGRVECDDPSGANSARDLGNVATFVLVGGGVLTAVGAVLYLTAPTSSAPPAQHASRGFTGKQPTLTPTVALGPHSAWLSLSGAL